MDIETASYITKYYSKFYNEKESLASRHWSCEYKITHGTNKTIEARESMRKLYFKKGWMTENPEILKLLSEGIDIFKINTASRILADHSKEIFLNKCLKCGELARTPTAKQCKHCGYNWHKDLIGKVTNHSFFRIQHEGFFMECYVLSGKIETGDFIDFYHFALFDKGIVERIDSTEQEIGRPIRMTIKISGLSPSSENFLLTQRHSKTLEITRIENKR